MDLVLTTDSGAKADGSYLPKVQTCQGMIKLPLYDVVMFLQNFLY